MDFDDIEDGMFGQDALEYLRSGLGAESSLKTIMQLDDKSSSYLRQGKYFEAYGLLKSQYKLGPRIHFAPVLVQYYATLMHTDRADKANRIRDELAELLSEKFGDSAEEVCRYADELLENDKYWEAALFFQIAVLFCEKSVDVLDGTEILQWCAAGLTKSVIKIHGKKTGAKKQLKQHVMPHLKKTRDLVAKASSHDKKLSALVQANLLSHQGRCNVLFRELDVAEKFFKEAVDMMEHYHKSEADKYSYYADILGCLGVICYHTNRHDEAEKHLKKAIEAAKKAKDSSVFESNEAVRKYESVLKKIKEQKMT